MPLFAASAKNTLFLQNSGSGLPFLPNGLAPTGRLSEEGKLGHLLRAKTQYATVFLLYPAKGFLSIPFL